MHLHRAGHDDIARQMRVESVGNPVDRNARVGAEVCHVDLCMHTCVRSAAAGDMHLVSHDHCRRLFQRLTDRDIIFLYLPAVIGGPEVAERQGNVSHSVLPCQKSITVQTAAAQSHPRACMRRGYRRSSRAARSAAREASSVRRRRGSSGTPSPLPARLPVGTPR